MIVPAQSVRVSLVAYRICMYQWCLFQNRRLWDAVKHRNENERSKFVESIWKNTNLKLTQMKVKQCNYYLEPGCGISTLLLLSLLGATV